MKLNSQAGDLIFLGSRSEQMDMKLIVQSFSFSCSFSILSYPSLINIQRKIKKASIICY